MAERTSKLEGKYTRIKGPIPKNLQFPSRLVPRIIIRIDTILSPGRKDWVIVTVSSGMIMAFKLGPLGALIWRPEKVEYEKNTVKVWISTFWKSICLTKRLAGLPQIGAGGESISTSMCPILGLGMDSSCSQNAGEGLPSTEMEGVFPSANSIRNNL